DNADKIEQPHMPWPGQTVAAALDEGKIVTLTLKAGEMSPHHARIVHGSGPNRSARRRIGYSVRYIPTSVGRQGPRESAGLARGTDRYGNFEIEPRPTHDYDPEAVRFHDMITNRYMKNYMSAQAESKPATT